MKPVGVIVSTGAVTALAGVGRDDAYPADEHLNVAGRFGEVAPMNATFTHPFVAGGRDEAGGCRDDDAAGLGAGHPESGTCGQGEK